MQPLTLIVENEAAYLNLIADCFEHGAHEPNRFATPNEDGLSLSDMWEKLPEDALYSCLGCYTEKHPPGTLIDTDEDWETYQDGAITVSETETGRMVREDMKLHYESDQVLVPKPEDYPILIHWYWLTSWDRAGDIKERHFMWHPLRDIARINSKKNPVGERRAQWEDQFGALRDRLFNADIAQSG